MTMFSSFIKKMRIAVNRWHFNRKVRIVLNTPPVGLGVDGFTALSMVHHRDVESYLLAIKSFCRFLHPQRIVVIADPSLTKDDCAMIANHILGVEIKRAEDYCDSSMPKGGTWERLIAISEYVQNDYVVQIDADTVAISDMAEVRKAIAESCSFVLATEDGQDFVPCREAAAWAKQRAVPGEHIQILAEASLDQMRDAESSYYVRGCSGFSGFAQRSFNRSLLREFSVEMEAIFGEKWSDWGTEQFSSNFMVANSPKATVLPHPKYCHPGREQSGTVFLHFIGFVRFNTNRYARAARETCRALDVHDI